MIPHEDTHHVRVSAILIALNAHHGQVIQAPNWFLMLLFLPLPAAWARKYWLASRKEQEGCCAVCGYDLRASKDRCPECGTPIPAKNQA